MRRFFYPLYTYIIVCLSGGFAYGLIELTARGRTHITMGLLGGAAMCFIHRLNEENRNAADAFFKLMLSAAVITLAELLTGLLLNVKMGLRIWNFSRMPYNLYGQICPAFSLMWYFLSGVGMLFDSMLRRTFIRTNCTK